MENANQLREKILEETEILLKDLQLMDVFLKGANIVSNTFPLSVTQKNTKLSFDRSATIGAMMPLDDKKLAVVPIMVSFTCKGTDTEDEKKVHFSVSGTFATIYKGSLEVLEKVLPEAILFYGQTTALFQAHPYIREYVNSETSRIGLQRPVTLRPVGIPNKEKVLKNILDKKNKT